MHCILMVETDTVCGIMMLYDVPEWMDFTDGGFSEWTCGGGRQVVTTWSQCGLAEKGIISEAHITQYTPC